MPRTQPGPVAFTILGARSSFHSCLSNVEITPARRTSPVTSGSTLAPGSGPLARGEPLAGNQQRRHGAEQGSGLPTPTDPPPPGRGKVPMVQ
jgi:hypothetical protein